jgi:hypothetical protein
MALIGLSCARKRTDSVRLYVQSNLISVTWAWLVALMFMLVVQVMTD